MAVQTDPRKVPDRFPTVPDRFRPARAQPVVKFQTAVRLSGICSWVACGLAGTCREPVGDLSGA
eukprot:9061194-Lingulodinium_polyedra.AAC.1